MLQLSFLLLLIYVFTPHFIYLSNSEKSDPQGKHSAEVSIEPKPMHIIGKNSECFGPISKTKFKFQICDRC